MVRELLGGLSLFLGAVVVLASFAAAYYYIFRPAWPVPGLAILDTDILGIVEQLSGVSLGRYIAGDVRRLVNAGLLALFLIIAQGIGYALMSLGARGLTRRTEGL